MLVGGRSVNSGPLHELVKARVISTDVIVEAASPELQQALSDANYTARSIGNALQIQLVGDKPVDPLVDLVRSHQARVVEIAPRKESLEDVVVNLTQTVADQRPRGQ